MKHILTISIILFCCGCLAQLGVKPSQAELWEPTDAIKAKAEQIGRSYALHILDISKAQLDKMKPEFTGWYKDGKQILWIQFYDPDIHQPLPEGLEVIVGGFPTYFTISIDADSWEVVDHYASQE